MPKGVGPIGNTWKQYLPADRYLIPFASNTARTEILHCVQNDSVRREADNGQRTADSRRPVQPLERKRTQPSARAAALGCRPSTPKGVGPFGNTWKHRLPADRYLSALVSLTTGTEILHCVQNDSVRREADSRQRAATPPPIPSCPTNTDYISAGKIQLPSFSSSCPYPHR